MLITRQTAELLFTQMRYTLVSDFKTRCRSAFEDILKSIPDNSFVAFVVHGGVIMSILEAYAYPKKGFYDYHIENGKNIFCQYDNCKRCFYIER